MRYPAKKPSLLLILLTAVAALVLSFGCSSEDNTQGPGGSGPITVDGIIFNPSAPAPGDTVKFTAVVTGGSVVGDFPSYKWTATGGEFLEDDKTTVRWIAPPNSSVFDVNVSASNSVSESSSASQIFVGTLVSEIAQRAGQMFLVGSGGVDAVYVSSNVVPGGPNFLGLTMRRLLDDGTNQVISGDDRARGFQVDVASTRSYSAHTNIQFVNNSIALDLVMMNLADGVLTTVATDPDPGVRPNQYTSPSFSPDGSFLTFAGALLDETLPQAGGTDTFVVYTYDIAGGSLEQATYRGNNHYPSISTDGNYVVFTSDRSGPVNFAIWELYALPLQGGVANDTITPPTQLTDTGGLMGAEGMFPGARLRVWNPMLPILAITDINNQLYFVDPSIPSFADAATGVRDMAWSPDGQYLAITRPADGTIDVLDQSGSVVKSHQAIGRDLVSNVSWSPDGQFLIFTIDRLEKTWWELWDVGGNTNLSAPVRITSGIDPGSRDSYTPFMSIRPVWNSTGLVAHLLRFDGTTAAATRIDLSGIAP